MLRSRSLSTRVLLPFAVLDVAFQVLVYLGFAFAAGTRESVAGHAPPLAMLVIGKHVLLPTPTLDDATRVKVTPTLSVFSVDGRMRLYHSPLYVVAGIGLLAAGMAENGIQTPGRRRLPEIFGTAGCVSFGMGISFRNGSFFTEARTTIGWNSVHSAPYNPFSVNHFCINLGYYLDR